MMSKKTSELNNDQVCYIKGCSILQRAVWRITHNDPLIAMRNKVSSFILRDATLLMINIRERFQKIKMRMALQKWLKICGKINEVLEKRRVLLKLIFLAKDAKYKALLAKYFQIWKSILNVSERDILDKYGALFKLLDYAKDASLLPLKKDFFERLRVYRNPNLLRRPAKKMFKYYDKNLKDLMRRVLNDWRNRANKLALKELKRRLLRVATVSAINRANLQSLLKALKNWHNNVLTDKIGDNKLNNILFIYAKWEKYNLGNLLHSAFLKWRHNTQKKDDSKERILNAKKHMLKHNINENAEDLLNAMKFIHSYDKRSKLLRKFVNKKKNLLTENLRKYLKQWYDNAKDLANRDLLRNIRLKHAIDLNNLNNRNLINTALLKALNTWRKNCLGPKTELPDTEKAVKFLRKATTYPFFEKLRQKMIKSQYKKKFTEMIKRIVRNGDKDLLHWWFGEWRKKVRFLKEYNFRAILINSSLKCDEEKDKLRALKDIQKNAIINDITNDLKQRILKFVLNKFEDLGKTKYKEKVATAFYRWKANAGHFKSPYELIQPYKEGAEILQRFVWRTTHYDILDAFDDNITDEAKRKILIKLLSYINKNYVKDLLRKYFYRWRMNCRKNNSIDKLRDMFDRYLLTEPIRSELMAPYKDIVDAMVDWYNEKQKAAKNIEDFLRGIKDAPSQIRNMKIITLLTKLCNKCNVIYKYKLKSALKEWTRRARALKAESDAKIIQKFIREKLRRRLLLKERLEEAIELTTREICRKVLQKLLDAANKNKIPDILMKYFMRKEADDMKNLKDKFDHWKNLLPFLRRDDAATYIQAVYRGKKFRDGFDRGNKIMYLLSKILVKYANRNDLEPAWQKWKKNDRLEKCDEDSKIIQHFLRNRLAKKLKNDAKKNLKDLFKDLFFKKLAEMMKKAGKINPEAAENLYHLLMDIACREPFNKLKQFAKWNAIKNKLQILPDILDRLRKDNLKKYLDRWYENGFLIPNEAAEKIQAVYRGYLFRKAGDKDRKLTEIMIKLIGKYVLSDDEKKLAALMKWSKNARLDKCEEDSIIIQRFCRKLRVKMNKDLRDKWANLAKKLLLKRINNLAKFKVLNDLLNKLLKKRYLEKLLDNAFKERAKDILNNLLSKHKDKGDKDLLRQKFNQWRDNVKKLRDLENDAATYIQSIWRGYKARKGLLDKYKLQDILMRLLQKAALNSRNGLLAALQKWSKNARLSECEENSTIIQDFSKKFLNKLRRLKYLNYLKKIGEGLKKLGNLRPHIKWAFDKIRNAPKEDAFHNLMDTLKNIFNKRKKDTLDDINKYIINLLLSKLLPFRENYIDNILRKKLRQWNDIAQKLKDLDNRLKELLLKLLLNYGKNRDDLLRYYLNKWKKNAGDLTKDIAANRIARYLNDRFKISNARKNWKNLADKLRDNIYSKETNELINGIKKLMALNDLFDDLNDKIKKDGLNQLESGNNWLKILGALRKLFDDQNDRNNNKLLQKYLNKWKNITDKLNDRENKLNDALDKIGKRQLIKDINDISDASITAQVNRAIPLARALNFLNLLNKKYDDENKLRFGKDEYARKLIMRILKQLFNKKNDYLRKKLRQWRDNAKKLTEEAAKKRIADYLNNKYLTSVARNNWKKLCDELDLYNKNKDLFSLLKKLKKIMALKNLADTIDSAFKKPLIDQLKDGADWVSLLKFLKNLFDDWDDRNRLLILRNYLNKWNDKAKKLKDRDDALDRALNDLEKRILINDINKVADASVTQQVVRSVPVARAFDFLDRMKKQYDLWNKLYAKFLKFLEKYIGTADEVRNNLLRRKLRQWRDNAHKLTEEAAKNRIARWTEERYRLANARKNWKDLADKYDMFINNRLLYDIRKRLRNYGLLKDLTDKLRNRFEKTGDDQFKEGVKFLQLLKFLKNLFDNWDDRNRLLILRNYLNKWNDKAKKLKDREEAIKESFDILNLKDLTNAANTVKDASVVKGIDAAVPVARAYDFLNRFKDLANKRLIYSKFANDLVEAKKEVDDQSKDLLLRKLYKIYYYKIIDDLFHKLNKLQNKYKKQHMAYFLKLLSYINMLNKSGNVQKTITKELEPTNKQFIFKAKKVKSIHVPSDRSVVKMLLPSLVKFLNDKFLAQKRWAMDNLQKYYRAHQFAKLYKIFSNKTILQPKRDLVDLMKAEYLYMNGLGASNCDLFKLLRKYWVRIVCDSLKTPSRVYKVLYLIKMVMMHKAIAYQRFIREMIRKWRFTAFISCLSKRKLELLYKNMHVSYLQMANEIFGDKGTKNASVIKEFERLSVRMGTFTNEDYNYPNEENYCEKIMKKYVFQPMQVLIDKEGPSNFFCSGIEVEDSGENNEDYYVDQDIAGETVGKYKQDTSKSGSRFEKRY